jgi:hypothetical protein
VISSASRARSWSPQSAPHARHAPQKSSGSRIRQAFVVLRSTVTAQRVQAAIFASCSSILSCGSLPVPAARMDSLRATIERATHAGALDCAPREIALARAHYDFAQVELRNGNATRAERHIVVAEQNVGAAQVLTPDRGCRKDRDETPTIPSSSVRARSAAIGAADGGELRELPWGAVQTDASCLTFSLSGRTDSASALTASQMSQHVQRSTRAIRHSSRLAISVANRPSLTPHIYGETRLDEPFAMSYVLRDLSRGMLSIGSFEL